VDTELLKTFLEVSRTRHFGRAAEALYLTQSAVSFRIRQLENQLGVNLFTRHRNNIRLTTAGEKLPYAETLMNTWQAARKEVTSRDIMNSRSGPALLCGNACLTAGWESSIQSPITCSLKRGLRSGSRWLNSCMNASLISDHDRIAEDG
jgi:DNA-binding transcriptional LysR family regulator